jgi:hypothetical protein
MKTAANFGEKTARAMGTISMIAWVLVLGPVGALLVGGVAYAMLANSLIAGALCAVLIFMPLFLTLTWGILGLFALLRGGREQHAALLLTTEPFRSSPWPADM